MKNIGNRITFIICGIFLVVGISFLTAGFVFMVVNSDFAKTAEEVTARISDIESHRDSHNEVKHRVYVDYIYGGTEYDDVGLNFYSSSMYVGKEIIILCDPLNPENIRSKEGLHFLSVLFIFIGTVFFLISIIPIALCIRKSARKKKVMASGKQLYATVEQITVNTGYRVNGRHPYVVYCFYRDEFQDVIYRFKSENLWTDPNPVLKSGDTVRIYVDAKDYSHYYVDMESILNGKIVDFT